MAPRWYHKLDGDRRRAFWTSFAGFALDAMDVQLYAFVLPVLLSLWGLSQTQAGALATVTLVSSAVGGWLGGLAADRIGRVRVLKITILCLAGSTCLCGFAQDYYQLLVARVVQGLGFGGEWAASAVLIAEIAAPESRARMVGAVQSAWAFGWGLAVASSALFLTLLPPEWGWRATFLIGFLPALLVFRFRARVKESPAFLQTGGRASWRAIFRRASMPATITGSMLATGMHGGYWAIATWWPTMLRVERGFSVAGVSTHLAVVVLGSLFGYGAAAWLGDRTGRRLTLIGFALGSAIVVLTCTRLELSNTSLLWLSFPLGFFALGMFSAVGPVLAELYPTELRGAGLGFCYNFGRGMAGATPVLVGSRIAGMDIAQALGLFAAGAYGLVVLAALFLPETRGRALSASAAADDHYNPSSESVA